MDDLRLLSQKDWIELENGSDDDGLLPSVETNARPVADSDVEMVDVMEGEIKRNFWIRRLSLQLMFRVI